MTIVWYPQTVVYARIVVVTYRWCVVTQVYEEEMEQQKQVLYRGFGTQKPGGVLANMFDIRDKVFLPAPDTITAPANVGCKRFITLPRKCRVKESSRVWFKYTPHLRGV